MPEGLAQDTARGSAVVGTLTLAGPLMRIDPIADLERVGSHDEQERRAVFATRTRSGRTTSP